MSSPNTPSRATIALANELRYQMDALRLTELERAVYEMTEGAIVGAGLQAGGLQIEGVDYQRVMMPLRNGQGSRGDVMVLVPLLEEPWLVRSMVEAQVRRRLAFALAQRNPCHTCGELGRL